MFQQRKLICRMPLNFRPSGNIGTDRLKGRIPLSWSASISAKRNGGDPSDPDYFMPYIMRMMGEILSDYWGEYICSSNNKNRNITLRFLSDAAGEGKAREICFERIYETGEDSCAIRRLSICLDHPHLSIGSSRVKEAPPYPELKKRMNLICPGRSTTLHDAEYWEFWVDLEDFKGKQFVDVDEYSLERWFEFARALTVSVLNIANRAEREMDAVFREFKKDSI